MTLGLFEKKKQKKEPKEIICPRDRLVCQTRCPYCTAVRKMRKWRGQKDSGNDVFLKLGLQALQNGFLNKPVSKPESPKIESIEKPKEV